MRDLSFEASLRCAPQDEVNEPIRRALFRPFGLTQLTLRVRPEATPLTPRDPGPKKCGKETAWMPWSSHGMTAWRRRGSSGSPHSLFVIAGLDPAIHAIASPQRRPHPEEERRSVSKDRSDTPRLAAHPSRLRFAAHLRMRMNCAAFVRMILPVKPVLEFLAEPTAVALASAGSFSRFPPKEGALRQALP